MAFGGFPGVVEHDKKTLESAPCYGGIRVPSDWTDRGWRGRVDKYERQRAPRPVFAYA